MAPAVCPNCGAELPPNAMACPECGSDEKTGWSDDAREGDLGLPEEKFDYDDFVAREFGTGKPIPRGIHWFWWLTALFVLAAFLWLIFR